MLGQGIQKQSASMDVTIDVRLLTFRNIGKLQSSLIPLTASTLLTYKSRSQMATYRAMYSALESIDTCGNEFKPFEHESSSQKCSV